MTSLIEDLKSFLDSSPTSWHAVKQMGYRLSIRDFHPLEEKEPWKMETGSKYFVTRGGSFAAFHLPKKPPSRLVLLAAHTDSPSLKVKPYPDKTEKNMALLEVESYGGPILHSWLNRDLALAGRIFVTNKKGEIHEELVFLDDAPMIIPELAIHLNRDVNENGPLVNKQDHMMPLFALNKQTSLELLFRRSFSFDSLLSFDLFLVPIEPARLLGTESEMLASYRIDNLVSAHAALCALATHEEDTDTLPLAIFWDHEEVGSRSWEGAMSSFLEDLFVRLRAFYKMSEEDFLVLKNKSLCLSLDMAHAANPMHMNKHDPNHQVLLGKGIALKSHADLKYASSAFTVAKAVEIAKKADLPLQHFVSRSDIACGSTVGPFITAQTGIPTLDLGCPQLSMHSCRELIAVQDYLDLTDFLTQALKS